MNKHRLRYKRLLRADSIALVCCILIFLIWPQLDLLVSDLFYDANQFYWDQNLVVQFIYKLFAKIHFGYLLALLALLIFAQRSRRTVLSKQCGYLLCCLLLGPGILVNLVLKDNSLGRPRPVHIQHYGGEHRFAAAFHYSGVCRKNCSFVSGHAAIGYYFLALAWALRKRYWLYIGLLSGLAIGGIRIVQGGHFLSDVVFAGWVVYFTSLVLAKLFQLDLARKVVQP
ncbi:MAG: phosphatase PAP2 family protein [Cellvibrionaceae bacterium]|nr:phosphatase PAP2 family protein [Cellvibrionaceae bacterium]